VPPPASDLVVRPVRADEHDAVGRLTVTGYAADGHLTLADGTYDHEYAAWLGDVSGRAADSEVLVAVDGDRLLGTVTWCPHGSPSAQLAREPHQGEFRTLSVDPRERGRGAARALVEACLERARGTGLDEVLLCSLAEMTPAHRLYLSMGFVRRPDLDWSPPGGGRLWAFALTLGRAPSMPGGRADGR
jgi:GNAT superfamily N-acetyltransferase